MTYNEKIKSSIMKWRELNADKYKESQKLYQQKIYKENYTNKRQEQKKTAYQWKRQTLILLNILNNLYPL
jgi:hypothetical protein